MPDHYRVLAIITTCFTAGKFLIGCYTYQAESFSYYPYKFATTYSRAKGSCQPFRTFYNTYNGVAETVFGIGTLCQMMCGKTRGAFPILAEFEPTDFDPNSCTGMISYATVVPDRPCKLAVRLVWQCQTNEKLGSWDTNLWTDAIFRIRGLHHDTILRRDDVFYERITEPKRFAWVSECKNSDDMLVSGPCHDVVWSILPYSRPFFYFDPMLFSIEVLKPNTNPRLQGMKCRAFVVENTVK